MHARSLMGHYGGWGIWILASALPAQAATADPQGDISRAVAAELAGDSARAFRLYLDAAQAGSPEAQFNVAVMYDSGRGAPHDTAEAALYYAFAASNGDGRAAYSLGLLYQSGDGVPRNPAMAQAWFQTASQAGVPAAADMLRAAPARLETTAPDAAAPPLPAMLYPPSGFVIPATQDFVPLVWAAHASPSPTFYFVQLASIDGGSARDVLTSVSHVSAIRAPIGRSPGQYAWRVFAAGEGIYAATPWQRFSVSEDPQK